MAKKITHYDPNFVESAAPLSGQEANLVQGTFIGLDSAGKMKPAYHLAANGPVVARGVVLQDANLKDPKGNVLENLTRVSYARQGRIGGLSGLTIGSTYYLHSGGAITATKPAAVTGDIDQKVGFAISATELVIEIGPEVIKA